MPAPDDLYRDSHRGAAKAADYDVGFWTFGTAKAQNWTIERRLLARVFDRVLPRNPQRALDFACGTGRVLAELERRVPCTYGIDVSPDMLEIAQARCTQSHLIRTDVTDPDAAPPDLGGPVDLVTAFRFFLNAEPNLRRQVLLWIRGQLSSEGRLVANFHLNPHSMRGAYLRARWLGRRRTPMVSPGEMGRLFADAGYVLEDLQGYEYLPYRRDGAQLAAPVLRARVEDALFARRIPRPVAGCHLAVARPV